MANLEESSENVRRFPRNKARQNVRASAPEVAESHAAEAPVAEAPAVETPKPVAEAPVPANDVKPARKRSGLRRLLIPAIAVIAVAAGGWWGYDYWAVGQYMVSTDDAYVGADIATISPKVGGYVASVDVVANQKVKAGDPLVTLDDGDYQIAVKQAQGQIATQKLTLNRIDAQIAGAKAAVEQATAQKTALQAAQHNAELSRDRAAALNAKDFGSQATLDAANAALDQANANLAGADAAIAAAQANVTVLQGQRAEAESALTTLGLALDKAQRDLGFTVLRAPYDGVVGNLAVQKGDLVSAGTRLMAVVPSDGLYVDANFKETQLPRIAPGEKVSIKVDALDGDPITGTVESISPASGSVFSLLPPENATGNFTKVVQRVAVRIALPADVVASGRVQAGLSVVVDADSRTMPSNDDTGAAN